VIHAAPKPDAKSDAPISKRKLGISYPSAIERDKVPFNNILDPKTINVHALNVPIFSIPVASCSLTSNSFLKSTTMVAGSGLKTIQNRTVWNAR
jgi:hypothetical protein